VITDDDVMRLFERADPARSTAVIPSGDAAGYLDAIRTRSNDMTITRPAPTPTEPTNPRRFAVIGVAAAAVLLVVGGALAVAARDDSRDGPSTSPDESAPAPVPPDTDSAAEIAAGYLDAVSAHDAERAATHLSAGALERLGGRDQLGRQLDWDRATGFRILGASCEPAEPSPTGAVPVTCSYDYQGMRSDELGLGPFGGSTDDFTIQNGEIISMSVNLEFERNGFSSKVWEPFADWVSRTHPDDAAVMYSDASMSDMQLTDESIRLWELHTHDYVGEVIQNAVTTARDYQDAFAGNDIERATSYLSDDALASLGGLERLGRQFAWDEASGFEIIVTSCEPSPTHASGIKVVCSYDFHGIRSDEMGLGPFGGSQVTFLIRDGMIVTVAGSVETTDNGFSTQVWEPFAAWVLATHPEDVPIMYSDSSQSDYRVTDESIRLWDQRTRDYVQHVISAGQTTQP
jgi:hypothetical protein